MLLTPGWHNVTIDYARGRGGNGVNGGDAGATALRLFIVDAAAVNAVTVGGVPSYEIVWAGNGKCCTGGGGGGGGGAPPCAAPVDCCAFRAPGGCAGGAPAPALPPARSPVKPAAATPVAAAGAGEARCAPFARAAPRAASPAKAARTADGRADVTLRVEVGPAVPSGGALALAGTAAATGGGSGAAVACAPAPTPPPSGAAFDCSFSLTLPDAFDCTSPELTLDLALTGTPAGGAACAPARAPLSVKAGAQPVCRLFAVDMGYCGAEGLVTDRDRATAVLACTEVRERQGTRSARSHARARLPSNSNHPHPSPSPAHPRVWRLLPRDRPPRRSRRLVRSRAGVERHVRGRGRLGRGVHRSRHPGRAGGSVGGCGRGEEGRGRVWGAEADSPLAPLAATAARASSPSTRRPAASPPPPPSSRSRLRSRTTCR